MRKLAFALVAVVAGCGGGGSTQVGTSSTPPSGGSDGGVGTPTPGGGGGMPGGGGGGAGGTGGGSGGGGSGGGGGGGSGGGGGGGSGGGGGGVASCPSSPMLFAAGIRAGAADGAFLYGFGDQQLRRVPLAGGGPSVVVDGIDARRDNQLFVDDVFAYWVVFDFSGGGTDELVRAPKTGGNATPLAYGEIRGIALADAFYFVDETQLARAPRDGGVTTELTTTFNSADVLAASADTIYWVGAADGFALHAMPLASKTVAHSSYTGDADGRDVFVSFNVGVYHYDAGTGEKSLLYTPATNGDPLLRVAAGNVYLFDNSSIIRVSADGAHIDKLADGEAPFTVAGDSVYFTLHGDTYRVCR
jgi:hypothetical protein